MGYAGGSPAANILRQTKDRLDLVIIPSKTMKNFVHQLPCFVADGLAAQSRASPIIAKSVRCSTQPPWKALHSSVGTSCAARQVVSVCRRRQLQRPDERGEALGPEQAAAGPRGRVRSESY